MSSTTLQGFELSAQQRRLWLRQGQVPTFSTQGAVVIRGDLDPERMRQALEEVVARHEILHTIYRRLPGMKLPFQALETKAGLKWKHKDSKGGAERYRDEALGEQLRKLRRRPFDLEYGPLLWAQLLGRGEGEHVLLLGLPALAADGWSLANLVRELAAVYAGSAPGAAEDEEEPLQYMQFSEWQEELLEADDDEEAEQGHAFWRRFDELPDLRLPFEGAGEGGKRFEVEGHRWHLDGEATTALEGLAGDEAELEDVLLAAWQVVLARLASQRDVVVARLFDNRKYEDLHEAMGLFAKYLPLNARIVSELRFEEMVPQAAEARRQAWEWQEYGLLRKEDGVVESLPYAFEFFAWPEAVETGSLYFALVERYACSEPFRLKLSCARRRDGLAFDLLFDPTYYSRDEVERLAERFAAVLEQVRSRPDVSVAEISVLTPGEHELLVERSGAPAPVTSSLPMPRRFAQQALETPEALALVFEDESWTYGDLLRTVDAIAHRLVAAGVVADQPVGLVVGRSAELVVGALAIWRAGGAYLYLDPELPAARRLDLLQRSGARVVLGDELLGSEGLVTVPFRAPERGDAASKLPEVDGDHLAYVLFTSGSTGEPKGVMVEHGNLASYVDAASERLDIAGVGSWATVSTFAADLGHTALFPALTHGATVHVVSAERIADPVAFGELMERHQVEGLKIVPSHLKALTSGENPAAVLPRKVLVLGGEACGRELIERVQELVEGLRVFNHYGPTETTVGVTAGEVEKGGGSVPLGRPLGNAHLFLADARGRLAPDGVLGEIQVGGHCVSRGYLGDPARTAERFVPDAWSGAAGGRLYRTGDLGRFRGDSALEFHGRADDQVKLRGFRIELGEVEARLRRQNTVAEAVAVVRSEGSTEQLVAYVTPRGSGRPEADALRRVLVEEVPEYMVPAAIVVLDALPLTANGKVDRKSLPAPEEARGRAEYAAPRNAVEEALAAIWERVLGVEQVGIHEGFFALGGDSILAIQAVGQANREGLALSPQQLFKYQTLAELAPHVEAVERRVEDDAPVVGEVPLLPIQSWFFESGFRHPEHWNQSFLFRLPGESPDLAALERTVGLLVEHHDALRARFVSDGKGGLRQEFAPPPETPPFELVDHRHVPEAEHASALGRTADELQAGFDLARGPLFKVVWFDRGAPSTDRLFLVAHHLVIDGVSWRVLLEDFQATYERLCRGEEPKLPRKTTSYKTWTERLAGYANGPKMVEQRAFWSRLPTTFCDGVPVDAEGENTIATTESVGRAFAEESTRALLKEVPTAYNTRIDEVLLTALARSMAPHAVGRHLLVEREGHGREDLFEDVDLSRTVGWFTTHYPVALPSVEEMNTGQALMAVKESLRAIPSSGIGFGILRYLGEGETSTHLASLPQPEIGFNYLGQLDRVLEADGSLETVRELAGRDVSEDELRSHRLDLAVSVVGNRLQVRFTFSTAQYERRTIEGLMEGFLHGLQEIVDHCTASPEVGSFTPSDFPLADLDQGTLDRLQDDLCSDSRRPAIEDLYPLTPLQESLLYHALSAPGSQVGFEQSVSTLAGELDFEAFDATWRYVIARHAMLRTAILTEGLPRPLQLVHPQVDFEVDHRDWRHLSPEEQESALENFLVSDRRRGFDLTTAPLLRVALIRLGEERQQFVWNYHHLILDGWCRGLVLDEVFSAYDAFRHGREPELPPRRPYREYMEWLARQDQGAAEAFWRQTLEGLEGPNDLYIDRLRPRQEAKEAYPWVDGEFDVEHTDTLETFARDHGLTLNSLVQGCWALMLSRYSGRSDAVHGTTVSGRPTDLPHADTMLGMFVNNLPVRLQVDENASLVEWFRGVQEQLVELRSYEYSSPSEVQKWSDLGPSQRLFDTLVLFQNYPVADVGGELTSRSLRIEGYRSRLETNYVLTLGIGKTRPLALRLFYDHRRFDAEGAGRLVRDLSHLLRAVPDLGHRSLRDLSLASASDPVPTFVAPDLEELLVCERGGAVATLVEGRDRTATWMETQEGAGRIASELAATGIGAGSRVGLWVDPTPQLVAAALAVLRVGAALVPLDPHAPGVPEDLDLQLRFGPAPTLKGVPERFYDAPPQDGETFLGTGRQAGVAWITPTGMELTPGELAAALVAAGFRVDDTVLVGPSVSASTLLFEVLRAAVVGCSLRFVDRDTSPETALASVEPTVWTAHQGAWARLFTGGWRAPEGFRARVIDGSSKGLATALAETGAAVERAATDPLEALALHPVRRLGERVEHRPAGLPGELVAFGEGGRILDSGRTGRRLEDGTVEMLPGGSDLGEIEALLARHPGLLHAAVVEEPGGRGCRVIFTPRQEAVDSASLSAFLADYLPAFRLPTSFLEVEALPLCTDGTVDRSALAELAGETGGAPPRTAEELVLVGLFEELFDRRPISIHQSFFELGGHSLMAVQLLARIRGELGAELPLSVLLEAPSVESLARRMRRPSLPGGSPLVPIQPQGERTPLFCVHPGGGNVLCYVELSYRLGADQPLYAFEARGREAGETPLESVESMAELYVEALRRERPDGPYRLAGWSFGGLVAFEMARQLSAAGEEVLPVVIFDTFLREEDWTPSDGEILRTFLGEELPIPLERLEEQGGIEEQIRYALAQAVEKALVPSDYAFDKAWRLYSVRRASIHAGMAYARPSWDGSVLLFRAAEREREALEDATYGWSRRAGRVEVEVVPGDHDSMLRAPHAEVLARRLEAHLVKESIDGVPR